MLKSSLPPHISLTLLWFVSNIWALLLVTPSIDLCRLLCLVWAYVWIFYLSRVGYVHSIVRIVNFKLTSGHVTILLFTVALCDSEWKFRSLKITVSSAVMASPSTILSLGWTWLSLVSSVRFWSNFFFWVVYLHYNISLSYSTEFSFNSQLVIFFPNTHYLWNYILFTYINWLCHII